jgi:hypothetical protein
LAATFEGRETIPFQGLFPLFIPVRDRGCSSPSITFFPLSNLDRNILAIFGGYRDLEDAVNPDLDGSGTELERVRVPKDHIGVCTFLEHSNAVG